MFCYGPLDVALRLGPKVPIFAQGPARILDGALRSGPKVPIFAQGPARILDVALCLGPKVPLEWAQAPTVSKLYAVIGGPD
jgi:hypothetical protein